MVKINALKNDIAHKSDTENQEEEEFLSTKNFDVVCVLDDRPDVLNKLNKRARRGNVLFICGNARGLFGHMFVDLANYQFIV
jgi:hypothetical protein